MLEPYDFWDPNDWEVHVYGLLQDRHGPLNIYKVPARHKGEKSELNALFGSVQMSRWVLVVPLHDSGQVNAHVTAKTAEVKALGLPYVALNFEVMIQDIESFDSKSRAVRAILRQSIPFPTQPASTQEIEQRSEASENLVITLRNKLGKRVGDDENTISESVGAAI